jgi:hypothetical protein
VVSKLLRACKTVLLQVITRSKGLRLPAGCANLGGSHFGRKLSKNSDRSGLQGTPSQFLLRQFLFGQFL